MFLDGQESKDTTPEYKSVLASEERMFDKKWGPLFNDFKKDKMSMSHNFVFIVRR